MKLSALEIKSQEFKRALRGLDEAEVQSFLDMVASQWQEVQEDLRRNEERVRELGQKIVHYQKIEEALQEALTSAKASSKATVAEAERRAELVVKEAEIRARALVREAESHVRNLYDSADTIGQRRKEIVARLRAFLHSELEMLDDYRQSLNADARPSMPTLGEWPGDSEEPATAPVESQIADREDSHPRTGAAPDGVVAVEAPDEASDDEIDASDYDDVASNQETDFDRAEENAVNGYDSEIGDQNDDRRDVEYDAEDDHFEALEDQIRFAEHADERSPVEHQYQRVGDGSFDGANIVAEAETDGDGKDGEDDVTPENTESRIRRILDKLG